MTGHGIRGWAGAGLLAASVLLVATAALAETKPPAAPSPKASKWEGPELDAGKSRPMGKPQSWFNLPEKDDEVLVQFRGRRKGQ